MLKKTIKYVDYDGNEREEDFYFNISKAELAEMELSTNGGMQAVLEKIIKEKDREKLIALFKSIVLKSYGEKSMDGKRFIKNDELTEAFTQTEAYSNLFMELVTDAQAASDFVNGIVPKEVQELKKEQENKNRQEESK